MLNVAIFKFSMRYNLAKPWACCITCLTQCPFISFNKLARLSDLKYEFVTFHLYKHCCCLLR